MSALDVIVGILAVATAGSVGTVIAFHWRVVRSNPLREGLRSWHVVGVAVAQLCLMSGLGAAILFRPAATPASLVTGLYSTYIAGTVLTIAALLVVGQYQRHQFRISHTCDYQP